MVAAERGTGGHTVVVRGADRKRWGSTPESGFSRQPFGTLSKGGPHGLRRSR